MIEPLAQRAGLARFLIIAGLIVALIGLRFDSDTLFGIAVFMLALCGLIWIMWKLTFFRLSGHIELKEIRAFQGEQIDLTLTLSNRKFLPLFWVNGFYDLPLELSLENTTLASNPAAGRMTLRTFWSIGPYQILSRRFTLNCPKRGYYMLGPLRLESGDPFGFFAGRTQLPKKTGFFVYPHLYTVAEMGLPANLPFGEARAVGRLYEDPLRTIGIREWERGDQMRRIHWKATAKQQKLHSRVYEPAEEEQILLFLNVATLEKHWQGYYPELQERAISVAGGLAYQISEQRLPVGLIANGFMPGQNLYLRQLPGRAPGQLTHILELLARITPMAIGPIEDLILYETPRVPLGTTLVVVTAVIYPNLMAVLEQLSAAGRSVVLLHIGGDPPPETLAPIEIYHLGHLSDDLDEVVAPVKIK